ncbi:MAG: LacI family DNA-binding transcriptional regulator [Lachnospiraceae bacterium]|nr:LacI family DNA-binding transcriptional regulator [Lachnospiraceae bacterium]
MASDKVTMQDIADACGLSRNTVSKVFNGRGNVPKATRDLILKKAEELGYKAVPSEKALQQAAHGKVIALLTRKLPTEYHFGTFFVTTFTDQVCRAGYTLKLFEISEDEQRLHLLPPQFIPKQTAGIVGIELFDPAYLEFLCGLGIPTIMMDGPTHASKQLMKCDFISMESLAGVLEIMHHLIGKGAKKIGFFGDNEHCGSFYDRWLGYCIGLQDAGLKHQEKYCILDPDSYPYGDADWIASRLSEMEEMPDAFVCANDFLAVHLMNALKKNGLSVPGDVMVTGFDGTPQSAIVEPPLTTVQFPSVDIGRMAADILLSRIGNPTLPFSRTQVRSTPVFRASSNS